MITREEDIDAHALHRQRTISAIARHLGRDPKTIRAYLRGDREPGVRAQAAADPFGPFAAYCAARLAEDPHLWATTVFDEVTGLGGYAPAGVVTVSRGQLLAAWREAIIFRTKSSSPLPGRM